MCFEIWIQRNLLKHTKSTYSRNLLISHHLYRYHNANAYSCFLYVNGFCVSFSHFTLYLNESIRLAYPLSAISFVYEYVEIKHQYKCMWCCVNYSKSLQWKLTSACVVVWTGAPVVWRIAIIAITAILSKTIELIWTIFAFVYRN